MLALYEGWSMKPNEDVIALAREVAAETSDTDSVGSIARLFARKVIDQHEELQKLRAPKPDRRGRRRIRGIK